MTCTFKKLKEVCEAHVNARLNDLEKTNSNEIETYLDHLDNVWRDHCKEYFITRI